MTERVCVLHPLGAGGMGEVYAGFDETLQRRVALKAIHAEHRLNADSKVRFLREARILSQLDHPNICRVHDYIEGADGDWLVLELIDGKNLRAAAKDLDSAARLKIAQQIADVLVVTHAAGVIHRDLKPGNVMIAADGMVKVLDFGLARSMATPPHAGSHGKVVPDMTAPFAEATFGFPGDAQETTAAPLAHDFDGSQTYTAPGALLGTLGYMSPEQASLDSATAASDMYSFGLLLQELFTGQRPYDASQDFATLLARARRGETSDPSGLDPDLTALTRRLKSLSPTQRPTAVEAAERLGWIRDKPRRRVIRLTIAAAVVILALGALKYTFDLARERNAAVAARQDADRRRQQAESLIGFMLGDLRTRLQQAGRLELLDAVGKEATAYFNAVPSSSITGEELFRRSQAMYQIGQIRQAEGNLPAAAAAYRDSLSFGSQAVARDPTNGEWQIGLGTAHFYLAEALRAQRDLVGAMSEHSAYRDIAQALVAREPGNERWLLELSYGLGAVAAVQEAAGDLTGARSELEAALRIKEELAGRKPMDVERRQAIATGHNRLGAVLDEMGEIDAALQHYSEDLRIREKIVAQQSDNVPLKRGLQVALSAVGRAYEDRGDLQAATVRYRRWRDVTSRYAAIDPRNLDWQRDAAVALSYLAGARRLAGNLDEAELGYRAAVSVLRPIAVASPTAAVRQRDVARAELGLGETRFETGDLESAAAQAQSVERFLASLLARGDDPDAAATAAEARLLAADVAARRGDGGRARERREAALALLAATSQSNVGKRILATQARALLALGRMPDAGPIVERLTRLGYLHPTLMKMWRAKAG